MLSNLTTLNHTLRALDRIAALIPVDDPYASYHGSESVVVVSVRGR